MRIGMRKLGRSAFAAATVTVCFVGLTATSQPAEGAKPCPKIFAPVICDNGNTYANQCLADKVHATGCVPYPVFPP